MNTHKIKLVQATETYNQLHHVPEIRRGGILCASFSHILTPAWQNRWSASDSQNDIMSLWLAAQRLRTVVWIVTLSAGANKDPLGENPVFVRPNPSTPSSCSCRACRSLSSSIAAVTITVAGRRVRINMNMGRNKLLMRTACPWVHSAHNLYCYLHFECGISNEIFFFYIALFLLKMS